MKNPHELQKIAAHMTSAPVSPEADVAMEMELGPNGVQITKY